MVIDLDTGASSAEKNAGAGAGIVASGMAPPKSGLVYFECSPRPPSPSPGPRHRLFMSPVSWIVENALFPVQLANPVRWQDWGCLKILQQC